MKFQKAVSRRYSSRLHSWEAHRQLTKAASFVEKRAATRQTTENGLSKLLGAHSSSQYVLNVSHGLGFSAGFAGFKACFRLSLFIINFFSSF